MYDSGEIQEVESNYSGRLSFVSGQFAMVPSSRSMLSRDKRLPLDTWNIILDCRKTFFGNQFSTFDPPRDHNSLLRITKRTRISSTRGIDFSQEMTNKIEAPIPMPIFAGRRPSTMNSFISVEFRRILWLDSKDSKYRSCNSINSPIHNHY